MVIRDEKKDKSDMTLSLSFLFSHLENTFRVRAVDVGVKVVTVDDPVVEPPVQVVVRWRGVGVVQGGCELEINM